MSLQRAMEIYLPQIEHELRLALATPHELLAPFYGMMHYHMGWADARFQPAQAPTGKRLRPLFCLLACQAAGGDPTQALPAAAAIELLHNFSLIHDDIEDHSETRRHRRTVWSLWGQPQAINVGDGMLALAHLTISRLPCVGVPSNQVMMALVAFQESCLTITEGQYLDMSFEERFEVDLDEYLWMIRDKTACLLATSTRIGALLAGASSETVRAYREFGDSVGMAFQIQDDILGIWGDEALTGKPAASDILQRKKTLPLVYAIKQLKQAGHERTLARLREIYAGSTVSGDAIGDVLRILEAVQARDFCEQQISHYHEQAMQHLDHAASDGSSDPEGIQALRELAISLIGRQS